MIEVKICNDIFLKHSLEFSNLNYKNDQILSWKTLLRYKVSLKCQRFNVGMIEKCNFLYYQFNDNRTKQLRHFIKILNIFYINKK